MIETVHTRKDADYCLWYFEKHICKDAALVGAFGKGKDESKHDIDIHLPDFKKNGRFAFSRRMSKETFAKEVSKLIDSKKFEFTDWGGVFFHGSRFGNVDVFFDISGFDY